MKKIRLNADWTFKKDSASMMDQMLGGADDKEQVVTLPHDAMVWEERNAKNSSGNAGGFYPGGDYSYTKTVYVPAEDAGKTYIVEFEGIYNRGRVYVNGNYAGRVQYGYTRLILDITQWLNFGADNTILVKVTNSDVPNSRWYTGSGLYRPANLYVGDALRIPVDGITVTVVDAAEEISKLEVVTKLSYDGKEKKKIIVKTVIKDMSGKIVAWETTPEYIYGGYVPAVRQRIFVRNAALWSVDAPNLYHCEVTVYDGETEVDSDIVSFGIRSIQMDPEHGLRINGAEVLLRGGCLHHDNGVVGAATFARAEERRVELMKAAGFNALRIAHNTASRALLDACDRIGMLVMDESFDMWTQAKNRYDSSLIFEDCWEEIVDDIITKDKNHPCVIMYSIGNEIQDLDTVSSAGWNRALAERFRQGDPSRPVTNAINGLMTIMDHLPAIMVDLGMLTQEQLESMMSEAEGQEDGDVNDMMTMLMGQMNLLTSHKSVGDKLEEVYSVLDAVGLNYMRDSYEVYQKRFPNMVTFGSETLPPDIDLNWKKVKEVKSCIGDFTWTGWDYIGEAGVGVVDYNTPVQFFDPYPCYLAYCGDIDITGHRRPISYYREIVWGLRKEPYIAVQYPEHYADKASCTPWSPVDCVGSWTWNGYEGMPCKVEVYSDADEIELFVNDRSLGRAAAGEEHRFKAVFDTVYEPGTILAVAYKNGEPVSEYGLETAGEAKILTMEVDRCEIEAGEDDLAYVMISVRDTMGRLNTSNAFKVRISADGAGTVQGFGSGDPLSAENFFDSERTTFNGKVLAAIRSGKEPGVIRIMAEADGLEAACTEITVK